MAFFKFRKGADEAPSAPAQPQSVEAIRQRAKYRLVGATVLVLVGVIGLPLLFDKQPRPIAVDTPIDIPDKAKALPLVIPAAPASAVAAAQAPAGLISAPAQAIITETAEAPKADVKPASDSDKKQPLAQVDTANVAIKNAAKEAGKTSPPADATRAQALLEGKSSDANPADAKPTASKTSDVPAAASTGRFVVQVGAFADNARAHEVRLKLERAGLKTYAQAAETKDGRRIRVRAGPYATKAEAEKAAEKIKKLNLPAALLTL